MQRDFFRQPVFAYLSSAAICLLALVLAWQHPSFLSFSLVILIGIITVLMLTTLLRSLAIQESLEAEDEKLQLDAELHIASATYCKTSFLCGTLTSKLSKRTQSNPYIN